MEIEDTQKWECAAAEGLLRLLNLVQDARQERLFDHPAANQTAGFFLPKNVQICTVSGLISS
jgi:hypothetical protein